MFERTSRSLYSRTQVPMKNVLTLGDRAWKTRIIPKHSLCRTCVRTRGDWPHDPCPTRDLAS